ncbi:hypothetical protein L596_028497 [Steinernema carpocapsae]|uniref:Uncharacterized protein n=1 Tax=Steinernema carpocapsae TaxID=34508 RepID=A0A4U5LYN6_STECR|nr:hypothetical protein L596_028497 [Steinernema carpocapsae]
MTILARPQFRVFAMGTEDAEFQLLFPTYRLERDVPKSGVPPTITVKEALKSVAEAFLIDVSEESAIFYAWMCAETEEGEKLSSYAPVTDGNLYDVFMMHEDAMYKIKEDEENIFIVEFVETDSETTAYVRRLGGPPSITECPRTVKISNTRITKILAMTTSRTQMRDLSRTCAASSDPLTRRRVRRLQAIRRSSKSCKTTR